MRGQWAGKNIDLTLVNEAVERFFTTRGFQTTQKSSESGYTIIAKPQPAHTNFTPRASRILERVIIHVQGASTDFWIEFSTEGRSNSTVKLGLLTSFFGGGSLVLRGLKSQEAIAQLEKDFWIFIEDAIAHLITQSK